MGRFSDDARYAIDATWTTRMPTTASEALVKIGLAAPRYRRLTRLMPLPTRGIGRTSLSPSAREKARNRRGTWT